MTAASFSSHPLWAEFLQQAAHIRSALAQTGRSEADGSPREVIWSRDKVLLYRFRPLTGVLPAKVRPVLLTYALVNRPEILDLQPERSLVRQLLAAGLPLYLIDWGRAEPADRHLELSHYIEDYLDAAVGYLLESRRTSRVNLVGVCQGGTFSLCYCALHPKRIANLVTMVTPVDFHTPADLLSKWARHLDTETLQRAGNLPGAALTALFLALRPFRLMQQKYVALLEQLGDPQALDMFQRMERWIFDNPDQAASAVAQFIRWFYQQNGLVTGTLELRGRRINLGKLHHPILNIYATQDHIVPPAASRALRELVGSDDYSEFGVDTGHIGLYVSRRSQDQVAARIGSWLQDRS